ncbi:MAG TPA: DEAD/DEAH box helicase family protein [Polyangiaceae bacterium]|nr:DEAD/DEAH box helicase family protein [Polyangiaceae bacterium]
MAFALRPYQRAALDRLAALVAAGARRVLLVSPTGSGKTVLAVALIAEALARGERVLFVAHRRELVAQTFEKLRAHGVPARSIGVLMGNDPRERPGAAVQVASIDTLRNRPKPPADLVFVDEAHRALAKSYRDLAAHYEGALQLGLTATPYRADNRPMANAYDELLVVASVRELIAQGHLVEPRVFTVPSARGPDLAGVRLRGHDYDGRQLARAMDREGLVGDIVEHWGRLARGLRTVVFATSVEHSRHIAARFVVAGVPAEHLDGETPVRERDAILRRVKRGKTLVVSNCGVLCEGWDLPAVKACVLARPTKSLGLYLQQAGRILRPWEGASAVLLDHAGCVLEHGLPQDERELTLGDGTLLGTTQERDAKAPPVKACPSCQRVVPAATWTCPECGHAFALRVSFEEKAGELVEALPGEATAESDPRAVYDELLATAVQRGYREGWAYYRFRELYGRPPPRVAGARGRPRPAAEAPRQTVFAALLAEEKDPAWALARYRVEMGARAPLPDLAREAVSADVRPAAPHAAASPRLRPTGGPVPDDDVRSLTPGDAGRAGPPGEDAPPTADAVLTLP